MLAVPFAKQFRFKAANWKCGWQDRVERSNKVTRIFSFCAFTAMRIAPSAGRPKRPKCGASGRLKPREGIIPDLALESAQPVDQRECLLARQPRTIPTLHI